MDTVTIGLLLLAFLSGYVFNWWLLGSVQKRFLMYSKEEDGNIKYSGRVTVCGSSMESLALFYVAVANAKDPINEAAGGKRI